MKALSMKRAVKRFGIIISSIIIINNVSLRRLSNVITEKRDDSSIRFKKLLVMISNPLKPR
jgi:hypothetical protein